MAIVALPMVALASTTWFVDADRGSNAYSGLSSFLPKRTIQAAINAAAPGDYVMVAGGTYYENLTLSKRLTLFAYEPATPIVNGRLAGHCLLITENASGCVVDGFCFEKGAPTNSGNKYGGGIDCLANATIRHCTFRNNGNSSTTFAGGLHTSNGAQVLVENCLFVNNYAWACGGATLTEGNSTAIFDRCTVYGNRSDDYIGNEGGISVANTGTVIVRSCILWGNTGMQLAAYGSYYGAQSTIRVSYSCVQGGVAANGAGHFYNDGGNISVNPLFLDIPRHNFWFHDNSPCWRKGHPDYFEADGFRLHMGFWASRVRPLPPPVWQVVITLDANGGDCCVPSVKRNIGDFVGWLPIPKYEGYDFLGWYDKAEGGRKIFPAEKVLTSRTYYAHWQQQIPPLFQVYGKTLGIDSLSVLGMNLEEGARDGKLYLNPLASEPLAQQTPLTSFEDVSSKWTWQPRKTGENVFVYETGKSSVTTRVSVAKLTFATQKDPAPPMPKDPNVSITPVVRTIDANGAGKSIIVQGRGKWTAAVSDSWIVLGATSGTIPEADGLDYVAYSVTVNTNIGQRVGYVYVNGYVHTITQAGHGQATLSTDNITCECEGGSADIDIDFTGRYAWDARPNDDWITVTPTHGTGSGTISCSIAPLNEVATRQGSVTIGDMTVTVFQYGRRMKLYPVAETRDYYTHVIPIDVTGLALTSWDVTPNASWISVVDAGRGKGSDTVTIAIGENPSWRARSGTVTIGTETYTITQQGRTDLEFDIDPVETTASVNGANGHIAVTGTPDLPWSVESKANWLTVLGSTASGTGNGNVFYTASPNSTLLERTGTIIVTPADKTLQPVTHTVRQPGAVAVLSPAGYTFEADGEAATLTITVPGAIEWSIDESLDWLTVQGSLSRVGSGVVTLQASPNNTVFARSGTIRIAERDITVTQKGREFEIEYEDTVFGTDGDMDSFSVSPDGEMSWKAVASDSWIKFMYGSDEGYGPGEVIFTVGPYIGDGTIRTGYIQIGEQKVYITQRAYDLSISPKAAVVSGNAGAGEIGVSAGLGDVWHAIRTEPWIIIEEGTETGTGSGKVRFAFTDNDTGKTRSGKIIIDGEAYTLTQMARVVVNIDAAVIGHGSVEGAGVHSMGEQVTLTAVPDDGYEFAYWTGAVGETMQNPIKVTADVAKSVTATFSPLTPEFISAVSSAEGVTLKWKNLAWAAEYRIYRAPSSEIPSAPLVTLTADGTCTWLDETGELEKDFWYWVVAVGADAETESIDPVTGKKATPVVISPITYENLKGATNPNPSTYQEGTAVAFSAPGAVTGYTFAGWEPASIPADATGPISVSAKWTANAYRIVYHANGGSGTTEATACEYDKEAEIAANGFVRAGYSFLGWATEENGDVVYAAGDQVTNLTATQNGVIELWAVWEAEPLQAPVITPADGSVFKTETCTVTITCATPDAKIYYSTNGRTPRPIDANLYKGPFTITDTTTVMAFAVKNETNSDPVKSVITHVIPEPLTLKSVLDETKLGAVTTSGDASWEPVYDETAKVGDSVAKSGEVGIEQSTSLETTVNGKGTLTFWWKTDCEHDDWDAFTYDHLTFSADGAEIRMLDGKSGWQQVSYAFDTDGLHTVRWTYSTDDYEAEGYEDCAWVDGVTWSGSAAPEDPDPVIEVPADATEVAVQEGQELKIVREVTINGIKTKVDMTSYLNIPAAVNGKVDLTQATVKEEFVKEALDPDKGAEIKLDPASPSLITPATRPGLVYTLHEGTSIKGMQPGASTVGDGNPWKPTITVQGGASGFYSIGVTK